MKCEDVQKELKAFHENNLAGPKKIEVRDHLDRCPSCSNESEQLKKLTEILSSWKGIEPQDHSYEKLRSRIESKESIWGRIFTYSFMKKAAFRFAEIAAVVVLTLIISQSLQKSEPVTGSNTDTINLYLTEHQDAVLRTVSEEPSSDIETRISVPREAFYYYEHIDGFPRYSRPGVILKGPPKSQKVIPMPEAPSISKGEILDLPQARKAVDFEPVAPVRLHPGYILDSIRKIEDYNSLHLIYTNGISTLSLFEQSLHGKKSLVAQDFREYAVYRDIESDELPMTTTEKATILAWRNGAISFVLIGKEDMSRLMDLAQTVSAESKDIRGIHE
jgi:hypothetical protein